MKTINYALLCIAVVLVCVAVVFVGTLFIYEPTDEVFGPEDGVWHCKELGVQISFEKDVHSIVIVDGESIICTAGRDTGSPDIYLVSRVNLDQCGYGEHLFWGRFVEFDSYRYVLKDMETKKIYIFVPGELMV